MACPTAILTHGVSYGLYTAFTDAHKSLRGLAFTVGQDGTCQEITVLEGGYNTEWNKGAVPHTTQDERAVAAAAKSRGTIQALLDTVQVQWTGTCARVEIACYSGYVTAKVVPVAVPVAVPVVHEIIDLTMDDH